MNFLLEHPLFESLAWAIIHSLWLFPLLTGIALAITQFSKQAARRHNVYLITLLSLPFIFLALCYWSWEPIATITNGEQIGQAVDPQDLQFLVNGTAATATTPRISLLPYLTLIYLFGLVMMCCRSVFDLRQVRKIRTHLLPVPPSLELHFKQLSQRFALPKRLAWKMSARVNSALTIGFLRPLIVFPIGLINQLSTEETEAILLHEVAHILRKDYLWNALQISIKNLLFYHPIVHWLCRRINLEREYACDDFVTQHLEKTLYAQSLIRTARYSITHNNQFSMQAQGKSQFSNRLRRLYQEPEGKSQSKLLLLIPLLLLPLIWATGQTQQQTQTSPEKQAITIDGAPSTTVVAGDHIYNKFGENIGIAEDADPKYLYFVDGIRVTRPEGHHLMMTMAYATISDDDPAIAAINEAEGSDYTHSMRMFSVEEGQTPTANPVNNIDINDDVLVLVNGKYFKHDEVARIPPGVITTIDIKGEVPEVAKPSGLYNSTMYITTNGPFELLPKPVATPKGKTNFAELIGPGFNYDNTVVLINGEREVGNQLHDLDKLEIAAMDLNLQAEAIAAKGYEGYRAILSIITKDHAAQHPELLEKKGKVEKTNVRIRANELEVPENNLYILDGKVVEQANLEAGLEGKVIDYVEVLKGDEVAQEGHSDEYTGVVSFVTKPQEGLKGTVTEVRGIPAEGITGRVIEVTEVPREGEVVVRGHLSTSNITADTIVPGKAVVIEVPPGTERLLHILDGKRVDNIDLRELSPDDIKEVHVLKKEEDIKALGYGTDFDGAIIITSKDPTKVVTGHHTGRVLIRSNDEEEPKIVLGYPSNENANILHILDGERIELESLDKLDPNNIQEINVLKKEEDIQALGYGTDFDGAIIIISKSPGATTIKPGNGSGSIFIRTDDAAPSAGKLELTGELMNNPNVLFLLDGKEIAKDELSKVTSWGKATSIQTIKDPEKLRALGYEKYEAVVKIDRE